MSRIIFRFILLSLLFAATVGGIFSYASWKNARETKVVFLDVGQGDAILISQGGNQVLIDGGRSGKTLLSGIARQIPFWDRTIETVIATHPDADHVGGFPELLKRYRVGAYVSTSAYSESEIFKLLEKALSESHEPIDRIIARRGLAVAFPKGGRLEALYPEDGDRVPKETNEGSIVMRFSFGVTDFLLTGDLPKEEFFLTDIPESEVLKLAHHGSKHSSGDTFLSRVRPEEAVISVGENRYGHPAPEVLARVAAAGVRIHRTDFSGDIVYRCLPETNRCAFASQ
jgi:competence protein ComEC